MPTENFPAMLLLLEDHHPPIRSQEYLYHSFLDTGMAGVYSPPSYLLMTSSVLPTLVHGAMNSPVCNEAWVRLSFATSAKHQGCLQQPSRSPHGKCSFQPDVNLEDAGSNACRDYRITNG
jgi:hypothetical protein